MPTYFSTPFDTPFDRSIDMDIAELWGPLTALCAKRKRLLKELSRAPLFSLHLRNLRYDISLVEFEIHRAMLNPIKRPDWESTLVRWRQGEED